MESHLISDSQFRDMAALETVSDAVEYLRHLKAYEGLFSDVDDEKLHRVPLNSGLSCHCTRILQSSTVFPT